ncbi:alpha/beta hydrolase [Streptomyces sp. 6N223]|uniref:alpha/beta hydrolase n=1 Tax=Streptomyces sp. 6N223 TaxID=3457412 RepID=UPI003FD02505
MPMARNAPLLFAAALTASAALTAVTAACSGAEGHGALRSTAAASEDAIDTVNLPPSLTQQKLDWSRCEAPDPHQGNIESSPSPLPDPDGGADGDGGETVWECATLTAPLDYADPEGRTIGIAIIRAKAAGDPGDRIGSLLFNFGGPGSSGVATLPAFGQDYTALHERYDLVSFDPRGVGDSEGVVCLDDRQLDDYFAADPVPENATQLDALNERIQRFADSCEERAGELLPHLTTANTARDLDLMREVLGDDKLRYFGVSYGTQLGGVYAHLFPERLDRAVFDAVVDPTLSPEQSARAQASGFQLALGNYVEGCSEEDDVGGCPLGDTTAQATERLNRLLEQLSESPMPTRDPDGRRLTESLAWSGIAQALYSQDFWPYLSQGLDDALPEEDEDPDGTILLALSDAMNGRNPDGTYTTLQSSLTAISCADSSQRYDADDARRALRTFREVSPVFGPPMAWGLLNCAHWPVTGAGPHPEVGAEGAPPILLIGTTGDPATPYEGTRRMKQALGPGVGVELTYDGEGHGAYTGGSSCVREAADAYLLDGKVPEDGKTCDD